MATVEVTPDFASVPRQNQPIEVVCGKGNLEQRMTLAAVPANEVREERLLAQECAKREPSTGERAAGVAAHTAFQTLAAFFPPAALGLLAVGVAAAATAKTAEPVYAYRQPPELLLAPTAFESGSARDAYFAALKVRLEAEAGAQRARVNQSCHPWPCKALEPDCANPLCADQRTRIDTELASRLDQLPELRARARIVPP